MTILDRIALNRLIKILTNFILAIIKILNPKVEVPPNPIDLDERKPRFPWLRKKIDNIIQEDKNV